MRFDHVHYGHLGGAHPLPADVEAVARAARRQRAEAVHGFLAAAASAARAALARLRAQPTRPNALATSSYDCRRPA